MKYLHILLAAALLAAACGSKDNPTGKEDDPGGDKPSLEAPAVPTGVSASSVTENSAFFEWSAADRASTYSWTLAKGGAEADHGSTNRLYVSVKNLSPATAYTFKVKAVNNAGESDWSEAVAVTTTGSDTPGPGPEPDNYSQFKIPEREDADGIARAFPGAEGGGMYTTGGRGGSVYHVTNLKDDSSKGSLRYGIESAARPLTIVFDVAGIIPLTKDLKISRGNLTIAGQTAPGDGICLKNYTVNITGGNIIIRYMRFRLGDEAPWTASEISAGKADGEDCIWSRYQENLILDHCSMSWSVDESASFYGNEWFTLQWCLIAESMKNCKLHSKGDHGYGGIWGGKNASFHHNILAHHDSRNARIDHPHIYENHTSPARRGNVDLRNNVIYDWGGNTTYGGEGGWFNIVNNYYKPGPSSSDKKYFADLYAVYSSCSSCNKTNIEEGYASLYLSGNVHTKYSSLGNNASGINWHNGSGHANYNQTLSAPLSIQGKNGATAYVTTHSAADAMERACRWAGASLSRDAVDTRIATHIKNGTGRIIKDIDDVKSAYGTAWPEYSASSTPQDSDGDGMSDAFEDAFGLDKNNASDVSVKTLDPKGRYTNLEMYLHWLVRDITEAQTAGGTYTAL